MAAVAAAEGALRLNRLLNPAKLEPMLLAAVPPSTDVDAPEPPAAALLAGSGESAVLASSAGQLDDVALRISAGSFIPHPPPPLPPFVSGLK